MRELHLFAGCGGGILAGKLLGHRCVGAVEIDAYCRRVLEARQADGSLEAFPIHDDVRHFDGLAWRGKVDVVCGGWPCQPWSMAGKRRGADDPRHRDLWPHFARIVAEVRPAYVFAENVSLAAFREPWRDLRGLGYRVPPALKLGSCDLGAVYHRHRWWLLAADPDHLRELQPEGREPDQRRWAGDRPAEIPADPDGEGLAQRQGEPGDHGTQREAIVGDPWRAAAPRLSRLVSRDARRLVSRRHRIHALGDSQVPAVAATAFRLLMNAASQ